MGRKGNLVVFESSNISETEETTLTKIGVHECDINPCLHKSFEPILWPALLLLFDPHGSP